MKRLLAFIIAAITVFSMVACGGKNEMENENVEADIKLEESIEQEKEDKTEEKEDKTEDKTSQKENNKKEEEKKPSSDKNTSSEKPSAPAEDKKPEQKPEVKPEEKPAVTPEPEKKPETVPEEKPAQTSKTAGNILLDDFKKRASGSSALSIAEGIATNSIIPFMTGAMPVEPGYLAGFDNAEITGFKEGASFGPMIGSVPFIGYVFILEDGTDAASFISNLKSNANLRWNICVEAEEMVAGSSGNKVFFVMCNKDLNAEE